MNADFYRKVVDKDRKPLECVELIESVDDCGWYAHEYDFTRTDNATRVSKRVYRSRAALIEALNNGKHKWEGWS